MVRSTAVYSLLLLFFVLYIPCVGYASEDEELMRLLSNDDGNKEEKSYIQQPTSSPKEAPQEVPSSSSSLFSSEEPPVETKKERSRNYLDEHMNTSVWQFYLGIHGGGAVTGTYGELTETPKKYVGVGAHPVVGGILGLAIQTTPNFAFRLGVNAEHLFKMKRFIAGIDVNDPKLLSNSKQTIEKTSLLGEMYFDFRSGLWGSFFIKVAGGYSWVTVDGKEENGMTAGMGLGLRWYAHKYLTFDWTILDARATFAKNISGDLGTQIGITFQY